MNRDIAQIGGSCHCGSVRFHVTLTHGLHTARRCTCSYCRMRGAVAVSADLDGVNHPADTSAGPRRAGVLRFVPAE